MLGISFTDWIGISSLIVAITSFILAYRVARLQTETFLMTLMAQKAAEANTFGDLGSKVSSPIHYQNAIAVIVQATQIYELIRQKHRFLLCLSPKKKFMSVFFLQWHTDLQNKLIDDDDFKNTFLGKITDQSARNIVASHLDRISDYLGEARKEFPRK